MCLCIILLYIYIYSCCLSRACWWSALKHGNSKSWFFSCYWKIFHPLGDFYFTEGKKQLLEFYRIRISNWKQLQIILVLRISGCSMPKLAVFCKVSVHFKSYCVTPFVKLTAAKQSKNLKWHFTPYYTNIAPLPSPDTQFLVSTHLANRQDHKVT